MGFFSRIFGQDPGLPPQGGAPPPNQRLRRDEPASLLDEGDAAMGPFPRKMKLRAIQIDYGLAGRWSVVSLESEASWAAVREQLLGEFYQRFGLIHLGDGTNTIRWNEYTWRGLRDIMKFEYDPDFAGQDPAGPSGA